MVNDSQNTNLDSLEVTTPEEKKYCILPLRDIVIFPSMIIPIFIGRTKSIATVEEAMKCGKEIVLVAQQDANVNSPQQDDLFEVGVKANIIQMLRLQDNTIKLLVEATDKIQIKSFDMTKPYWETTIDYISEDLLFEGNIEIENITKSIRNSFSRYMKCSPVTILEKPMIKNASTPQCGLF